MNNMGSNMNDTKLKTHHTSPPRQIYCGQIVSSLIRISVISTSICISLIYES